jgi:hypothetical protein
MQNRLSAHTSYPCHVQVQEVIADASAISGCANAAAPRLRDLDLADSIDYLLYLMTRREMELSDVNWEDLYCAFKTVIWRGFHLLMETVKQTEPALKRVCVANLDS